MSNAPMPAAVIRSLASRATREHHAIWHYVRDRWHVMTPAEKAPFIDANWAPPRLNPRAQGNEPTPPLRDPGSGLDFLFMHRQMIAQVDAMLADIADEDYPRVVGWNPTPWDHADPHWPMPPNYAGGPPSAKDPEVTARWRSLVGERYENSTWLKTVSLDELGAQIENGIHNWMHMHWAAEPWFKELAGQDEDDPRNDYLGSTYSSHVNPAFWKLHGWIDARIEQWEQATGYEADFAGAWSGPGGHHAHAFTDRAADSSALMTPELRAEARTFFVDR